ncbi:MAG: hypothetical protein Q8T13_23605 [Acidobacteriota bacterium]|nr:hypothetical protein [Acidobacteriota bacterium]
MDQYFNERFPGQTPAAIPFRIRLSSGLTRTDPSTFTADEIADAGYVLAPEMPEPEPGFRVIWTDGEWAQEPLPSPPVRTLSRFKFIQLMTPTEYLQLKARAAGGDTSMIYALEMLALVEHVETDHPLVATMLAHVVSVNLMTQQRADEIRDAFYAAAV